MPRKPDNPKPSTANNNSKFRSPSSNPTTIKPRSTTINRYKDVYTESNEDELVSNKAKERPSCNTISASNVAHSRLNSTAKKKPEVTIHTHSNAATLTKPRK